MYSRRQGKVPDPTIEPHTTMYARLDTLLAWLDVEVEINPVLKSKAKLATMLEVICKKDGFHSPNHIDKKLRTCSKGGKETTGEHHLNLTRKQRSR
jgi:hypothetical protein